MVVKVGGSLLDWPDLPDRLGRFLDRRREAGQRLVVVTGGGPAADWIRDVDRVFAIGDRAAHDLAIRSMDLTARFSRRSWP